MANGKKPKKGIQIGPDLEKVAKLFVDPFGTSEQVYEMGKKFSSPAASSAIKAAAKGAIKKSSQILKNPDTPPSGSGTVYIGKPRPNITPKTSATKMTATPIEEEIEGVAARKAEPHPINKKMEKTYTEKFQNPRHDLIEGDKNL